MATSSLTDAEFRTRFAVAVIRLRQATVDLLEVSEPGIDVVVYLWTVSAMNDALVRFRKDMEELTGSKL